MGLRMPRLLVIALSCSALLIIPTFIHLRNAHYSLTNGTDIIHTTHSLNQEGGIDSNVLSGGVVMSKLGNETVKAELGRSTWKFLHTMTQRFPEHPTQDERDALKSFLYLFSRLYPCGECAAHFQKLLAEFPPQTSSRNTASLYLCSLHNRVNERLGKPEYDCTTLAQNYDCGCGEPESHDKKTKEKGQSDDDKEIQSSSKETNKLDPVTGEVLVQG